MLLSKFEFHTDPDSKLLHKVQLKIQRSTLDPDSSILQLKIERKRTILQLTLERGFTTPTLTVSYYN